jgi:hypothetical protein
MATPDEADALGRARIVSGKLGSLSRGEAIGFGFGPLPDSAAKPGQPDKPSNGLQE